MLLKNKLYSKSEPTKDAKLIIIYCEGKKREAQYFDYFKEISSQIKIEVESPGQHDDTSPTGVLDKAITQLDKTLENPFPKYELIDIDEIWFVIDTDQWGEKINEVRNSCQNRKNWFVAQSNPCFEVWLFYHFHPFSEFDGMDKTSKWKELLHSKVAGGFNSRKHPVYIKNAIDNATSKFDTEQQNINVGCTEVFKLANSIYPLVRIKLAEALSQISELKLHN